jgi:hypothetical protein
MLYVITALKTAIIKRRFLRIGRECFETGLQKCLIIHCNWSVVKRRQWGSTEDRIVCLGDLV